MHAVAAKIVVCQARFNQHTAQSLNKRPLSITVISWLFIAVGGIALGYHLQPQHTVEFRAHPSLGNELIWVCLVRMLAIISGVFMLRGWNWARWLLVVWLACHVAVSALHSVFEVVVHGLLFGVIVYFLFRTPANSFFRRTSFSPIKSAAEEHTGDLAN
jgi:hypothetical protein